MQTQNNSHLTSCTVGPFSSWDSFCKNSDQLFISTMTLQDCLLSACNLLCQEEESSVVLDAITTGIGLAPFFERLEALFGCSQFQSALHGPKNPKGQMRNGQSLQQTGKEGSSHM